MSQPSISVTVSYGRYGEQSKTVAIQLSDDLLRSLAGRVELNPNNDFTRLISAFSPAHLTEKRIAPQLRKDQAASLGRALADGLLKAFSVNDTLDGYSVSEMSPKQREYYIRQGKLSSDYLDFDSTT